MRCRAHRRAEALLLRSQEPMGATIALDNISFFERFMRKKRSFTGLHPIVRVFLWKGRAAAAVMDLLCLT